MVEIFTVIWDKPALEKLQEEYEYIKEDSLQNAEKVKAEILSKAASLNQNPYKYPKDKFKKNDNLFFRAFEIYHYRISYYIDEKTKEIIVLRVRSTHQKPLKY